MNVTQTSLPGVLLIEPRLYSDDRGFFMETYNSRTFSEAGIALPFVQDNHSRSRRGVLRGLHYQEPRPQGKLVRCIRGAILDVAIDLRHESPSFRKWTSVELTADNRRAFYIPAGCAHGYQTLTRDAEVHYMIDAPYSAAHGRGVRWNDSAFRIEWPDGERTMNDRDRTYPDFTG